MTMPMSCHGNQKQKKPQSVVKKRKGVDAQIFHANKKEERKKKKKRPAQNQTDSRPKLGPISKLGTQKNFAHTRI